MLHNHLHIATRLTRLLDSQFKIGKFRFGLDPILGLFPIGGDTVSLILSLYILGIGVWSKLPILKIIQMFFNITIDYLIGLIPFFGDIFDFGFKANTKNLNILKEHLGEGTIL